MNILFDRRVDDTKTNSRRHYFRRKAVNQIRHACEHLPSLAEVGAALKYNPRVTDALLTLTALGLSVQTIVRFVGHHLFTESVALVVLARATAVQMVDMCFGSLTLTTEG